MAESEEIMVKNIPKLTKDIRPMTQVPQTTTITLSGLAPRKLHLEKFSLKSLKTKDKDNILLAREKEGADLQRSNIGPNAHVSAERKRSQMKTAGRK